MKIFTNKSIWKKIVIALLLVLAFQTVMVKPVQADVVEFGGKLMGPILSLLTSLGDGINDIIARSIMGANTTLYRIETGNAFWEGFLTVVVFVAAAALVIALAWATGGIATAVISVLKVLVPAAASMTLPTTMGVGTILASLGIGVFSAVWYNHDVLPEDIYLPMYTYSAEEIFKGNILLFNVNFFEEGEEIYAHLSDGENLKVSDYANSGALQEEVNKHIMPSSGTGLAADSQAGAKARIEYYFYYDKDGNQIGTSNQNSAVILRKTVSSWYNALRNICIVLMLSVLVYIGIRILLSTVASDKAKYLQMLKDWFIGLCLLFLMHYIMAFSVMIVEKLTDVVKSSVDGNGYVVTIEASEKIKTAVEEIGQSDTITTGADGKDYLIWPTNFMGSLRLQLQMEQYGAEYVGLSICFLVLCLFTLYFTITYLRRVLHLAFLTIIAPMVALTYCIDKLNDGKAQGFDKWFKEYIFNLLIQPMHLLLFYILITSAFEFASTNVIYSIVAIGFMIPAEKLLRSLFGFEKAQTSPAMGPAGAMMASAALTQMLNRGKKGENKKENGKGGDSASESEGVPNPIKDRDLMGAFLGETQEDGSINSQQPSEGNNGEGRETGGDGGENSPQQPSENPAGQNEGNQTDEEESSPRSPSKVRRVANKVQEGVRNKKRKIRKSFNNHSVGRIMLRNHDANKAARNAALQKMPEKVLNKISNAHPMRAAGKIAAGVALGTAAGATGVAIAASTGDLSNIPKIGGAAAIGGYAVGSKKAEAVPSLLDDPDVKEVYGNTRNSGEYKKDAMEDYTNNYIRDVKNRNYFEIAFGKEEAKKMMQKGGVVEQFLNNDVTDKKEIAAAYQMKLEGKVKNIEEAISVAQLGQMVGDTHKMNQKSRDDWKNRFRKMAEKSGVRKENIDTFADRRLEELDAFYFNKKH